MTTAENNISDKGLLRYFPGELWFYASKKS